MRDSTKFGDRHINASSKKTFKKILIFAEGQVTEIDYFEGMKSHKKELGIPSIIKIETEKRPEVKSMWSNIVKIVEFIELRKEEYKLDEKEFLREGDELWIIFDRDQITKEQYKIGLDYASSNGYHIGFTNSCFEMWLLLHFPEFEKYEKYTLEFSQANKTHIVSEVIKKSMNGLYGRNKKKVKFENFKSGINNAVQQSKTFNGDLSLSDLYENLGTSMHELIISMRSY